MPLHPYSSGYLSAKKVLTGLLVLALVVVPAMSLLLTPAVASAAVADWHKAATLVPKNTTDFSTENTKQSLRDLKATGANYVAFVVPYYQSNTGSTDIAPGWNTPTDSTLVSAINFAKSIGLNVTLKMHVEPYSGEWRAYINPGDRNAWFAAYGNYLNHLGDIGRINGVSMIVIGTELVSMAASNVNGTNTQNWQNMIASLRTHYPGKLTYGANSNDNGTYNFTNEKRYIGFWGSLDYAGLSTYYGLNASKDVDSLKGAWDYWNNNDIRAFSQAVGKQVLFTEIGYRSVENAHQDPWNWGRGGAVDLTEQANDYDALIGYWNGQPYMVGVYWWDWSTDPNAGGSNNSEYTPQNKPAEQVMTRWFTNPSAPPPPSGNPAFASEGSANPSGTTVGTTVQLMANIRNMNVNTAQNSTVDIEVYNSAGQKIFQHFYQGQQWGSSETRSYQIGWQPSAAGTYRMTVGVFSNDWTQAYHWNNQAATIAVTAGGTTPPPNNPPPNNPPPPTGSAVTNVWWPTEGARVWGVQPLKAMLEGRDIGTYRMYWQVDGGGRIEMFDSPQDYPHKEAWVDYSGWRWRGAGPYTLTFISVDKNTGAQISQKSVNIFTQ